jgi:7-cyano-7-deazaguanine synthase in queuosine biosynthesis
MKREVLLYTSGVDSFVARAYLYAKGHDFDSLYFNHGGMYCEQEIEKIQESCGSGVIINNDLNLSAIEEEDAHIPNRNILMTVMAHALGYKKVWLGGTLSDRVGDNKPGVFVNLSRLLTEVNEEHCEIFSPFYHCYKDDITRWYVYQHECESEQNEAKWDLLNNTFSCFQPTRGTLGAEVAYFDVEKIVPHYYFTKECLNCSACFRKSAVLFSAGIFIPFCGTTYLDKYYKDFSSDIVKSPRARQTIAYIEQVRKFWDSRGEQYKRDMANGPEEK